MDPLKGDPGKMSPMPFFLMRPCWDPQVIFEIKYLVLNLTKCVFDDQNVRDHLLIDIKYEKKHHIQ